VSLTASTPSATRFPESGGGQHIVVVSPTHVFEDPGHEFERRDGTLFGDGGTDTGG